MKWIREDPTDHIPESFCTEERRRHCVLGTVYRLAGEREWRVGVFNVAEGRYVYSDERFATHEEAIRAAELAIVAQALLAMA